MSPPTHTHKSRFLQPFCVPTSRRQQSLWFCVDGIPEVCNAEALDVRPFGNVHLPHCESCSLSRLKTGSLFNCFENRILLWRRKGGAFKELEKSSWVKALMSTVLWRLLGTCRKHLKSWLRGRQETRAAPDHNLKAPSDKIIFDLLLS